MQKSFCILTLYLFMFALNLFLHRFRNELARSLTNGNHFSSLVSCECICQPSLLQWLGYVSAWSSTVAVLVAVSVF